MLLLLQADRGQLYCLYCSHVLCICVVPQQSHHCASKLKVSLCALPLQVDRAKVLSNTIKQKRKEKAGKWEVPLPKVRRR
jgi:hypothetical protein